MTGYLQRLAAGAATIERPIHPVLPPIFAAAADSGDRPIVEEFPTTRAAQAPPATPAPSIARPAEPPRPPIVGDAAPPVAAAPAAPQANPSSSPPRVAPIASQPNPPSSVPGLAPAAPQPNPPSSAPRLAPAPLVAAAPAGRDAAPRPLHRDDPGRLEPGDVQPDRAAANAVRVPSATPDFAAPHAAVPAERDDGARRDAAPIGAAPAAASPPAPATRTDHAMPAAAGLAPMRPAAISAGAARRAPDVPRAAGEPHEVQIHIGRIEVTAAPPAPARPPAAAPRRRGMSLDDYLQRRNGRAP